MTISSCSNSTAPRRPACRALVLLLAGVWAGCAAEEAEEAVSPCVDETVEFDDEPTDVIRLATLRVEQRKTLASDVGGEASAQTFVTLAFSDRGLLIPQPREPARWSQSCFVLSGQSVRQCRNDGGGVCGERTCDSDQTCIEGQCVPCAAQPLAIQQARLTGLTTPDVQLDAIGTDGSRWRKAGLSAPLFGSDPVQLSVTGGDGEGEFPSYTQTVAAPEPMSLVQPTPGSPLALSGTNIVIEWEAGNGDWVEIALQLDDAADTATDTSVVCLVRDDGCAVVPSVALVTLAPTAEKPLELSVSRVVTAKEEKAAAEKTEVRSVAIDRVDLRLGQ